jgi:thiamine-monophosphate kinase
VNREKDIINLISGILPRSPDQLNRLFESDSEILRFGSELFLFTVDEFSNEDFFRDSDPYILGWNLAVGTISDILASGGDPLYYAHSLSFDKDNWDGRYLRSFSTGIGDVIRHSGAGFIGGDTNYSQRWHYTGIAIGTTKKEIKRTGASVGDQFYLTGKIGKGNLEAGLSLLPDTLLTGKLLKNYSTKLNFRLKESKIVRKFATSCIDTSDGLLNALISISESNNTGFRIDTLPYFAQGTIACRLLGKSNLLLLAGECGEYELLFTVKAKDESDLLSRIKTNGCKFYHIGEVATNDTRSIKYENKWIEVNDFEIRARNFKHQTEYLTNLEEYISWKIKEG